MYSLLFNIQAKKNTVLFYRSTSDDIKMESLKVEFIIKGTIDEL